MDDMHARLSEKPNPSLVDEVTKELLRRAVELQRAGSGAVIDPPAMRKLVVPKGDVAEQDAFNEAVATLRKLNNSQRC